MRHGLNTEVVFNPWHPLSEGGYSICCSRGWEEKGPCLCLR
jgi:hypothetical protein